MLSELALASANTQLVTALFLSASSGSSLETVNQRLKVNICNELKIESVNCW